MKTIIVVLTTLSLQATAWAQNPRAIAQAVLRAHGRTNMIDISAVGSVTWNGVTRPLNISGKRTGLGRLENGSGPDRNVFVFGPARSWAGNGIDMRPLQAHTAQRRLTLFPFLDLIADLDGPDMEAAYAGVVTINGRAAHKISIRTVDREAPKRFLRRPLEEAADFFIDTESLLIVRSERLRATEENMDFKIPSVLDFSDYRNINGVMVPFRIVNTMGSATIGFYQTVTVFNSVTINSGLPDSLFSPVK